MGAACTKSKKTNHHHATPPEVVARRADSLKKMLSKIYSERQQRLDEEAADLPHDLAGCLEALFGCTYSAAEKDLQEVYAAYDVDGSGTWTAFEARTFFTDLFSFIFEVALPLHRELIVRDRLLAHDAVDNPAARESVTAICDDLLSHGMTEAKANIRDRDYLFQSTVFKLVDDTQDGHIGLDECLKFMMYERSLEFEKMYITCLGLDKWLAAARAAADAALFGARKVVIDIDITTTPRMPFEGSCGNGADTNGSTTTNGGKPVNPYTWDSQDCALFFDGNL